jgi:hypothetical protein
MGDYSLDCPFPVSTRANDINAVDKPPNRFPLPLEPRLACRLHVAALPLSRMHRLFLNVMRRLSKKRHSVPMPTLTPRAFTFS